MLIGWTGDNGDPDNWLGTLLGCDAVNGNNFSKWCHKPFEELIQEAAAQRPIRARARRPSTKAQEIFAQATAVLADRSLDGLSACQQEGERHAHRAARRYARFDGVSVG